MAKSSRKKGNELEEIIVGPQVWLQQNLSVTTFRNGDIIPEARTKEDWKNANENKTPCWSHYDNDVKNGKVFGVLYNWYAVSDSRGLAPDGWHVASELEWNELIKFLGSDDAAKKIKCNTGWSKEDIGSNDWEFSILPGGARFDDFIFKDDKCYIWTSTPGTSTTAICKVIGASDKIRGWVGSKSIGMYVRCIKGEKIKFK
jgi:uncharacterized protein (TIGR02145 family)